MNTAVTQLISPFAACRFSRLSSCMSKEGPHSFGLSSIPYTSNLSRHGENHCNTCVIAALPGITKVPAEPLLRKNGAAQPASHAALQTSQSFPLYALQALFGNCFINSS